MISIAPGSITLNEFTLGLYEWLEWTLGHDETT